MKILNVFDIETTALPANKLEAIKPVFQAAKNLRDPAKIAEDIATKSQDWIERAALDATTGRVLCIGMDAGSVDIVGDGVDEAFILERFWNWLELRIAHAETIAGFCIFNFDLPFLVRRSWSLDVEVPSIVRRGRYWNEFLVDLADVWKLGNYDQRISLDTLAKTLGLGAKNGTGSEFAALWESNRKHALEYLANDLTLTRRCAERMLGFTPLTPLPPKPKPTQPQPRPDARPELWEIGVVP